VKGSPFSGFLGNASEDQQQNLHFRKNFMALQIGTLLGCLVLALLLREVSEMAPRSNRGFSFFDKLAGRRLGK
jgi:hypothetical protein